MADNKVEYFKADYPHGAATVSLLQVNNHHNYQRYDNIVPRPRKQ